MPWHHIGRVPGHDCANSNFNKITRKSPFRNESTDSSSDNVFAQGCSLVLAWLNTHLVRLIRSAVQCSATYRRSCEKTYEHIVERLISITMWGPPSKVMQHVSCKKVPVDRLCVIRSELQLRYCSKVLTLSHKGRKVQQPHYINTTGQSATPDITVTDKTVLWSNELYTAYICI